MVCIVALLTACQSDLPIKEMVEAKSALTLADTYKAQTYAKEEYDAAVLALLAAHDLIKNEKTKEAKDSAVLSKKKADEALAKTLPLLAKDTLDAAKAVLAEAQALFASEFAKEKFDAADALVKESSSCYDAKNYISSYEAALKAKPAAEAAKQAVLLQVPVLKGRLSEIRDGASEVRANGGNTYAKESLDALDLQVAAGDKAIAANDVKDAAAAVSAAGDLLVKARTDARKGAVAAKIDAAVAAYAKAQESPCATDFTARFEAIANTIGDAKSSANAGTFDVAESKAAEATALIDALVIDLQKKEEADKVAKAQEAEKAKALEAENAKSKPAVEPEKKPDVTPEAPKDENREYVVIYNRKSADCLWKIADKMYKNARLWPLIFMANRTQIKDPDLIYPGQKFIIPPVPKRPADKADALPDKPGQADTAATDSSASKADANPDKSSATTPNGSVPAETAK